MLDYAWDDSVSEDQRVHTPVRAIQVCPDHANVALASRLGVVLGESGRKEQVKAQILAAIPALADANGDFKVRPTISFSGTPPDRVITISIVGLTNAQRNALQNAADNRFGVGKIVIA